jgi:predicted ATPase
LAGDLSSADRFVNALLELSTEHAVDPWKVWAECFAGVLLMKRGVTAPGLARLRTGLSALPPNAFHINYTVFLAEIAEVVGRSGEPAKGLATIDEALARAEHSEELWCISELLRVKGELLLLEDAGKAQASADECFLESRDWARRQGALAWELRTSISRARWLRKLGRLPEARRVLAPICGRFTEGFATADLKTAKGLLDELA